MGIKIKNLQTGEFEKFNIPALKGEKGEPGEIESSEKVDYIGKQHSKLRDTMNANVDYAVKTAIGEFNYLDYKGQHITATNSIEGHARSAILSGQTLINVDSYYTFNDFAAFSVQGVNTLDDDGYITLNASGNWVNAFTKLSSLVKPNTKYLVIVEIKENTLDGYFTLFSQHNNNAIFSGQTTKIASGSVGTFKYVLTSDATFTPDTYICLRNYVGTAETSGSITYRTMLIEYQQGMENWDIPYFRGMQSVKMPVLTTTGKNLFKTFKNDGYYEYNGSAGSNGQWVTDVKFKCLSSKILPNTEYIQSSKGFYSGNVLTFWKNGKFTGEGIRGTITTFTTPSNCDEIRVSCATENDLQLELGRKATTYEDHKSNILTVNEDLELRGIGDVKDELNVATGELTQRFTKIVVDGVNYKIINAVANNDGNTKRFDINFTFEKFVGEGSWVALEKMNASVISDKAVCIFDGYSKHPNKNAISSYNGIPVLFIEDKTILSIAQANQWLSQNPITIQYELKTPIVKTVDLSDNRVYSYKGITHYSCSSEESSLVPTLSVKVPTDTQLTIKEQKATAQTLLIKNMDLQQSIKEVQAMNLAFNTALYNSFNSIREEVEDIKKHVSTNENLEGSF